MWGACRIVEQLKLMLIFKNNEDYHLFRPIKRLFLQLNTCLFVINLNKKMIEVTDLAKSTATRMMSEEGKDNFFIRVGVEGGGCSGLMYQLTFDNEIKGTDKEFESNGVKIVIDKKSFLYLVGTTLDYSGGLNGKGFVFKNPNAERTCGCGESFSL